MKRLEARLKKLEQAALPTFDIGEELQLRFERKKRGEPAPDISQSELGKMLAARSERIARAREERGLPPLPQEWDR